MDRTNNTKLIFVTTNHYMPTGGSEVLWSQAAKLLCERGFEIGACARDWHPLPEHLQELIDVGCDLHRIPEPRESLVAKTTRFMKKKFGATTTAKFGNWLRGEKPQLVVFSMGNSVEGFHLIRECQKHNFPYVILVQLVSEHSWLDDKSTDAMNEIYRSAEVCFFVSEGNRELVERMSGIELPNSEVIENPYTVEFDLPFQWPVRKGSYQIACVANLHSLHKGQDLLFKVLKSDKWKSRPVEFNLYGNGPHKELLTRLKKMWGLEKVNFCGFAENISEVWNKNQALVMPSRMEGMPLALKEAMLAGRVPIVTDVGGNAELVEDGINGFIAKAPTVELVEDALERAWARKESWEQIGARAYKDAHAQISPSPVEDFAKRLLKICEPRG